MRNFQIDVISGLLIIWMIYGHVIAFWQLNNTFIYEVPLRFFFFFMPWFFYKSGSFYKPQPCKKIFLSSFKKLVIPFAKSSIVGLGVYVLICIIKNHDADVQSTFFLFLKEIILFGSFRGNSAVWFLLTLFVVRNLYNYLYLKGLSKKNIAIASFLLIVLVLLLKNGIHYNFLYYPRIVYNSILGVFFYSIGHLLYNLQYSKRIISFLFLIVLISNYFDFSFVDFFPNKLLYGSYVIWIFTSIAAIIIINNIFSHFVLNRCTEFLAYCGKNSMFLLIWHYPLLYFVYNILT